jgi:RNA polymerase-binding transcription factor DksA
METAQARARLDSERARLLALRDGLEADKDPAQESPGADLSSADQHPADEGSETAAREVALSLEEHVEAELAQIDAALARLDAGTYGICEACGRPIEPERLEAIAYARLCIRDQQLAELEHRV